MYSSTITKGVTITEDIYIPLQNVIINQSQVDFFSREGAVLWGKKFCSN
jgi:hypothetical protein